MRTETKVLHFQKVAGISGSEAHLLSLLPRLAERGWDVRLLMLHEHEAGAWDFARELESRGVPLDAIPISGDVDPVAFMRLSRYLAGERPEILHTHLVHADAYGLMAGALARPGSRVDEARVQRVPRRAGVRARRPRRRQPRPPPHRDLPRARALARRDGGFDEDGFEIVHYGIAPRGDPPPYAESRPISFASAD